MSLRRSRLALLAVTGACAAPTAGCAQVDEVQCAPLNAWQVRSPSGASSHVLGTVHMGVDMHEALKGHARVVDQARTVMLEVDFGEVSPTQRRAAVVLPEGQDLATILGAPLFDSLAGRLPHLDASSIRRMAPWAAMSMVMSLEAAETQNARDGESAARVGLDEQIRARANALEIPVRGLETYADQVAMIQQIPESSIVEFLQETLGSPDTSREQTMRRTDAFLRGDIAEIEKEIDEQVAISPGLFEVLLFARNDAWMNPLLEQMEQGDAFVAVGLSHLLGERGLLRQLEARGYVTTRLSTLA